jgi:halocyanin-like protein
MDKLTRRRALSVIGGVGVGTLAGCTGGGDEGPYGGWLTGATGFERVVDRTDADTVTVDVGTERLYAFDPAAVQITAGTTVVWEWTGHGGSHNVVHADGSFESAYYLEAGSTFEHTVTDAGVYKYYCTPHQTQGMLGVIEVVEA